MCLFVLINNQKKNPTLSQVKKTNQENKFSDLKMNLEKTGGPSELFQKNRTELNSDEKFVVKGTAVGAFVGTVAGAAIGGVAGAFVGAAIGSVVGFAISATINLEILQSPSAKLILLEFKRVLTVR